MPDLFNLTEDMNSYFNSLPKNVQESMIQSGAKINSLEDMKAVVDTFKNGGVQNEEL